MQQKQTPEIVSSGNVFIFDEDPNLFSDFIHRRSRIISSLESHNQGLNLQIELYFPNDQSGFLMTFSNYQNPKTPTTEIFLSKLTSYDNILDLGRDGYLLQDDDIGDLVLRIENDVVVRAFYPGDPYNFDMNLLNLTNHLDRLLTAFGVSSETLVIGGHPDSF